MIDPVINDDRRLAVAAALDTATVVLFVAIGRRSHDQDPAVSGLVRTVAPFLIALAAGWIVTRAWRRPFHLLTGLGVGAVTIAVGMLLRRTVFDRGTALSFVVVATLFVVGCLLGWRLVAMLAGRRQHGRRAPGRLFPADR